MISASIILSQFGYRFAGSCNCSGIFTEKYRRGKYMVKWRKKRFTFKVLEDNSTLYSWKSIKELETTLNELAKKDIAA